MRAEIRETFGLRPMAHRPPLVWRFWIYAAAAYLMPVVVQLVFPGDPSSMDELVWLLTLVPAFILALHYGLRGAFVALVTGTVLLVAVQIMLALYSTPDDPRVTVPIYIAYGMLAISVGWLSEQLHEHYELALELRARQKTDALGKLAAGLAHDFNNVLNAMTANAELLAADGTGDGEGPPEELTRLKDAAARGAGMVRNLLGLSRTGLLSLRPLDIGRFLDDLRPRLEGMLPENVALDVVTSPDAPVVAGDPEAVEQILVNVVTNAMDAMPLGGRLRVELGTGRLDFEHRKRRGWGDPGEYAVVTVSDTGVGMDAEARRRIFEPFFTSKEVGDGIGLGMAMVYGLMKQHRGYVDVESVEGDGTTVTLYFPVKRARSAERDAADVRILHDLVARRGDEERRAGSPGPPPTDRPPTSSPRPGRPSTRRRPTDRPMTAGNNAGETGEDGTGGGLILIVEDEDPIRRASGRILERSGYRVETAADGDEALEIYERVRDDISLVLLDVVLPGRTGPEVYEIMRRSGHPPPVLFMSGYPATNLESGVSLDPDLPFLAKPWTMEDLVGAVRDTLARR